MADAARLDNRPNPLLVQLQTVAPFLVDKGNPLGYCLANLLEFAMDSKRLLQRCTKPDSREFKKIAFSCSIGFAIMGVIGYVVKLVFIPINHIIVGMGL